MTENGLRSRPPRAARHARAIGLFGLNQGAPGVP